MRKTLIILSGFLLAGCASDKSVVQTVNTVPPVVPRTTAAALAFDPPLTLAEGPINISRDDRGQAALVGFEETSNSTFAVFSDNRQATDGSDRVVHESVSYKFGQARR